MSRARLLVVNGDDFGVNHATNLAVVRAFRQGILTSASAIAPAPWFDEAMELACRYGIPVGVHATLTCEYSRSRFGPLTRAPELSIDGRGWVFPTSPDRLDGSHAGAVEQEVLAQVARVLGSGVRPGHLDAHMGAVPRWDGAFSGAVEAAWREFRLPFAAPSSVRGSLAALPDEAFIPVDRFESISSDIPYAEKKARMLAILEGLPEGLTWMACHPCEDMYEADAAGPPEHWGRSLRYTDLQVLCDIDVRRRVESLGIRLVSARDALGALRR